jgi:hypothetical protein
MREGSENRLIPTFVEIAEDLEAALEQFREIAAEVE